MAQAGRGSLDYAFDQRDLWVTLPSSLAAALLRLRATRQGANSASASGMQASTRHSSRRSPRRIDRGLEDTILSAQRVDADTIPAAANA